MELFKAGSYRFVFAKDLNFVHTYNENHSLGDPYDSLALTVYDSVTQNSKSPERTTNKKHVS